MPQLPSYFKHDTSYICQGLMRLFRSTKTKVLLKSIFLQVWVVSMAEPRLPLLVEDASRPDSEDVSDLDLYIK